MTLLFWNEKKNQSKCYKYKNNKIYKKFIEEHQKGFINI